METINASLEWLHLKKLIVDAVSSNNIVSRRKKARSQSEKEKLRKEG